MHKIKSLIASLWLFSLGVFAQHDTLKQNKKWYVPKGYSLEYAGGFGMLSAGVFYNPVKRVELDVTAGYTPPAYGNIFTLNFLLHYQPLNFKFSKQWHFKPITVGAFANFNFGKNIYLFWPKKYPDEDFYWWNSSMRYGPIFTSEIEFHPKKGKLNYGIFFQCLTNDLYIASIGANGNHTSIYLHQILVYGIGGKVFFKKRF